MTEKKESLNGLQDIHPQSQEPAASEMALLQKQLRKVQREKKALEAALRKNTAALARSEAVLAKKSPQTIWGLGEDD